MFLIQILALSAVGVLIGVAVGAVLPVVAVQLLGDALPVSPQAGLYPRSLALAATYGLLTAGAFALWPLARASQIPGAALFRDALLPVRMRARPWLLLTQGALIAALVGLTVAASPERGSHCGSAAAPWRPCCCSASAAAH